MPAITIQTKDFHRREYISITSSTLYDGAYTLGEKMSRLAQAKLKERMHSSAFKTQELAAVHLLAEMEKISRSNIFQIDGVNWLGRYLQVFYGFTKGAGLIPTESAYLQSLGDISCQTIFIQDKKTKDIQLIHIEENGDDNNLIELHRRDEGLSYKSTAKYNYRLVDHAVAGEEGLSFAYPGLCWAGGSFGINKTRQSFISVDTLFSMKYQTRKALWANAIASMIYDSGRIEIADKIFSSLKTHGIGFCGGYAIHLCELDTKRIASYEVSNTRAIKVAPKETYDRLYIAQTNYPTDHALQKIDRYTPPKDISSWDLNTAQLSLEIFGRIEALTKASQGVAFCKNNHETIIQLLRTIADPHGDIETVDGLVSIGGFVNMYEAGYVVGAVSDSADFLIGKLAPPPRTDEPYRRFYDISKPETTRFAGRNLLEEAQKLTGKS